MTIVEISGYVLFAHCPDWAMKPGIKRIWETAIIEALPGEENRAALRAAARRQLSFSVTAQTLQERVRLEARVDAAKLSGLGCAPLHGRGSFLGPAANVGANSLTLASTGWTWQAGDYSILVVNDQTCDVHLVASVTGGGLTLNLQSALNYSWFAGAIVWPLIFGKFTAEKQNAQSGWYGDQKLTIAELTSSRSAQVGITPAPGVGVGAQVVGKTNKL